MRIQHRKDDGSWEFWNFKTNKPGAEGDATFYTDEEGGFIFPKGLILGTYRIYEKNLGSNQDTNTYEKAYPDADHARVFTVDSLEAKDVTMYNPRKLYLYLYKYDMDGNLVSGVTFHLWKNTARSCAATLLPAASTCGWMSFPALRTS